MSYPTKGTSHGSPFAYDTHVPLLFYGSGIRPGFTDKRTNIKDIASTVASLLGVQMPNANTGDPILEVIGQ
jgi:phosphopentomutase